MLVERVSDGSGCPHVTLRWGPFPMATALFVHLLFFLGSVRCISAEESPLLSKVFPWQENRLPSAVKPDHYFLSIHPRLDSDTFTGRLHILVTVLSDTDSIVLNGRGLTILAASLEDLTPTLVLQRHLALHVLQSHTMEQLAFLPETRLMAGHKYQLSITYNGTVSRSFSGLYRASYQMPNGTFRHILATQMEPASARSVFPCFDEPGMKALFSLVVVREQPYITLSNMPKVSTKPRPDGLVEDHYLTSVRMSTYLLAFIVCDFSFSSTVTKQGVKVSVFAPSHQINQTQYALTAAVRILNFYEEYFRIPYPLPKIDLAAIPEFEAGAMENWGLLTFRETSLLYEEQSGTLGNQLWVSLVTAHELAHQWFGNLVTMQWWSDVWLNEGFACLMEYRAISHLEPSWNVESELVAMDMYRALERDSFLTSHPVSAPVDDVAQIRQMFDVISYSKGACILHMLSVFLKDDIFTAGIQLYLQKNSYSNTKQDDLWEALSRVATTEVDIKGMMNTWTMQRGYPLVTVRVQETRIHLQQQLFTKTPQNHTKNFLWQIPITFYTSSSVNVITHLMKTKEEVIDIEKNVSWVKVNVNSSGFYRVLYEGSAMEVLLIQLQTNINTFSATDRASLLDDVFHLASQGAIDYSTAFNLTLFLRTEKELLPISIFLSHMAKMMVKFSFSKQYCNVRLLKEHTWRMLGKLAVAQRWEDGDSPSKEHKRAKLLAMASGGHSLAVSQTALRLYHFWMAKKGNHSLPSSLRALIYRVGIRKGGDAEWDFLLEMYKREVSSKEKLLMLKALSLTSCWKKREWLLHAALQNDVIKTQNLATVVEQLASRPYSSEMVWRFLQDHWDQLLQKFSLGSSYLSAIVTSVTSHFDSQEEYDEVYDFFVTRRSLGHLSFVKLSLEMIEENRQWLETKTKPIEDWLQKNYHKTFRNYHYCRREMTYHIKWDTTIRVQL